MAERTCSVDGCDNPYRARGWCSGHYNKFRYSSEERHPKVEARCTVCDTVYQRPKSNVGRYEHNYCSDRCKGDHYSESGRNPAPNAAARRRGQVRSAAVSKLRAAARGSRGSGTFVQGPCGWCGDQFCALGVQSSYCSRRCKLRASTHRYRSAMGKFAPTPTVRTLVYERDGWICQLCFDPVDADLDPLDDWAASLDHIVCQSWDDEPDHSPENLRLAHRWCNSVRGDETYYGEDALAA